MAYIDYTRRVSGLDTHGFLTLHLEALRDELHAVGPSVHRDVPGLEVPRSARRLRLVADGRRGAPCSGCVASGCGRCARRRRRRCWPCSRRRSGPERLGPYRWPFRFTPFALVVLAIATRRRDRARRPVAASRGPVQWRRGLLAIGRGAHAALVHDPPRHRGAARHRRRRCSQESRSSSGACASGRRTLLAGRGDRHHARRLGGGRARQPGDDRPDRPGRARRRSRPRRRICNRSAATARCSCSRPFPTATSAPSSPTTTRCTDATTPRSSTATARSCRRRSAGCLCLTDTGYACPEASAALFERGAGDRSALHRPVRRHAGDGAARCPRSIDSSRSARRSGRLSRSRSGG